MRNFFILVQVLLLFLSNQIIVKAKIPANKHKTLQNLAICEQPTSSYVPGQLIITISENKKINNAKRKGPKYYYNIRQEKYLDLLKSYSEIEESEPTYEVNIEDEVETKLLLRSSKNSQEKQRLAKKIKFQSLMRKSAASRSYAIKIDSTDCQDMQKFARKLISNPRIEHIALNHYNNTESITTGSPRDPFFPQQNYLRNIGVDKTWRHSQGSGVKVGVVDDFLEFSHPDLSNNINTNFYSATNSVLGYSDHGTHVTGIIAAIADNNFGISGIAPKAQIVFGSAYDSGHLTDFHMARSIDHLLRQGVDVINISLGRYATGSITDHNNNIVVIAITNAISSGVPVVVAAGNENVNALRHTSAVRDVMGQVLCSGSRSRPCFFLSASIPNVISVASVNDSRRKSIFSNFGSLTISAPGENILSTSFDASFDEKNHAHTFTRQSGTSMAAPIVTGVIALLLELKPNLTPSQIRNIITANSNTDPSITSRNAPMPRVINAEKAIENLRTLMSIDKPIIQSSNISGQTANVSWSAVNLANFYQYRINGANIININATNLSTTLLPGNHNFEVRACNEFSCGAWSNNQILRVLAPIPGLVRIQSPSANANINSGAVSVSWLAATNANSYEVRSYPANTTAPNWINIGNTRSFNISNLQSGARIFEIRAINSTRQAGQISTLRFNVNIPTTTPTNNLHHNAALPEDIHANGQVFPINALIILTRVASQSSTAVPSSPIIINNRRVYLDVNNDGHITALDALLVLTYIGNNR
jgi:subtilisin family serine protease